MESVQELWKCSPALHDFWVPVQRENFPESCLFCSCYLSHTVGQNQSNASESIISRHSEEGRVISFTVTLKSSNACIISPATAGSVNILHVGLISFRPNLYTPFTIYAKKTGNAELACCVELHTCRRLQHWPCDNTYERCFSLFSVRHSSVAAVELRTTVVSMVTSVTSTLNSVDYARQCCSYTGFYRYVNTADCAVPTLTARHYVVEYLLLWRSYFLALQRSDRWRRSDAAFPWSRYPCCIIQQQIRQVAQRTQTNCAIYDPILFPEG